MSWKFKFMGIIFTVIYLLTLTIGSIEVNGFVATSLLAKIGLGIIPATIMTLIIGLPILGIASLFKK